MQLTIGRQSVGVERLFSAGGQNDNDSSWKWTVKWIIREAVAFTSKQSCLNLLNINHANV